MGEKLTASNVPAAGINYAPGKNNDKILTTTLWTQNGTVYISVNGIQTALPGVDYNAYCPYYYPEANDKLSTTRAVTGCTNTADSQIIYYWIEQGYTFDFQVTIDDWFEVSKGTETITVTLAEVADYKAGDVETINEILARGDYKTSEFIAALNYYCGVKNNSIYGSSTGTLVYYTDDYTGEWNLKPYKALGFDSHYAVNATTNAAFFTFTTSGTETKTHLTEVGYAIARECLDYGEVITVSIPGHSIYLDGYRYNEGTGEYEYHLNYGWGINSTQTKWYTEAEMINENIDTIGIDITPKISAHIFNGSAEYNAGTMLRAAERINHTQNDTSTTVSFADNLANTTSIQQETFAIISDVDIEFDSIDFNLAFATDYGFLSYNTMDFTEVTGNLILNSENVQSDSVLIGLVGNENLSVNLNSAGVYAGTSLSTDSIISALEGFGSLGYESISVLADSAIAYAFASSGGDDTITLSGNSIVMGDIDLGDGNNVITIKSGSSWFGDLFSTAEIDLILDSQTDEAFIIVSDDISGLCDNGTIYVTMDRFTQGVYTLVDGSRTEDTSTYLSNLDIVVTSGGVTETLSIAGNPLGQVARIYLDNGKLKLTDASSSSQPETYEDVMIFSSGFMKIKDSFLEGYNISAGVCDSVYAGSNGVADSMQIGSGGFMHVMDEGLAVSTEIVSSGKVLISSGGSAFGTVIKAYGSAEVLYGGTAETTDVMNKGTLLIASSGTASDTKLLNSGKVIVLGNAVENYISGGTMLVSAGGTADLSYITSGGNLKILAAGSARDTIVEKYGTVFVADGGIASTVTLDEGMLMVSSGGQTSDVLINAYGKAYVEKGGIMNGVFVENQGNLFVQNGGTAQNAQVNSWGSMTIARGGKGENTSVFAGGILTLEMGGSAVNTTLDRGDLILMGGDANNVKVSDGGRVYASSGTRINGGEIFSSGYAIISSGAIASSVAVREGGLLEVNTHGTTRNVTVNSGGSMYMKTGAEFISLNIQKGGIINGFTMNVANLLSGEALHLSNCVVNNEASLEKGQSANVITVYDWAQLNVLDGASVTSMTAYAGAILNGFTLNEDNYCSSGLILDNVYADGEAFLYKGQSVSNAEIYNGANLVVDGGELLSGMAYAGAVINGFTLRADNIYTDGLTISHGFVGGDAFINEGSAENIVVGWGGTLEIKKGDLNSVTIQSGGTVKFTSGASAVNAVIENGGVMHINSGVHVSKATIYGGGSVYMKNEAHLETLTLASGGTLTLASGGTVKKSVIWSNGALILSSGAAAQMTMIENGGGLHVYSGATASGTVVNQGGYLGIGGGAKAYDTTIGYAGELTVWGGGEVHSNTIHTWGAIILSSGAIGNSTTILANGGYHIYDGAIAYTTEVASGANLGIGLGGTVYNLEVNAGANATFYDDSILRGWSDFAGNITVNEDVDAAGAMIAFTITERSASDGNIITNAEGIAGASYFLTLDSNQADGRYKLAGNAANISSLTITGTSTVLEVGGAVNYGDGLTLALGLDSGNNLYLEIARTGGNLPMELDDFELGTWDEIEPAGVSLLTPDGEEEKSGAGILAIL